MIDDSDGKDEWLQLKRSLIWWGLGVAVALLVTLGILLGWL